MSGIAAILRTDGAPVLPAELNRVLAELAHRGPAEERHEDGALTLGCRWDPEPFDSRRPAAGIVGRGGVWVAADARIDNRDELLDVLPEREGTRSDAELVLDAYLQWDIGVAASLEGDFAFVLWDSRSRRLLGARDAMGIRPLYYGERAGQLRCASEAYCIVADGRIDKCPDETQLALYLLSHYTEHHATLYRRVCPVPAAHTLVVEADGRQRLRRDWEPNPWVEVRHRSDAEYGEHFHEVFARAVRDRVPRDRPCAVQTSGGLDSSSVICEAARQARQDRRPPPLLTRMVFPGLNTDESEYSDAVADRWGLDVVSIDPREHAAFCAPEVDRVLPDLLFHTTQIHVEPMFLAARERGIRTVLTGMGGDDLMRPTAVDTEHHLVRLDMRAALRSAGVAEQPRSPAPWRRLLGAASRALLPASARSIRQVLSTPQVPGLELIHPQRRSAVLAAVRDLQRQRDAIRAPTRMASANVAFFVGPSDSAPFLSRLDRMGARRGVEYAHPLLDRRVGELLLALPLEQRVRGRLCKPVLRSAMIGILPEIVRTRTSAADLTSYVRVTLERQRPSLQQMFECSFLGSLHITDADVAARLLETPVDRLSMDQLWQIMNIISLELWLRRIEG